MCNDLIDKSQQLLLSIKLHNPAVELINYLANVNHDILTKELVNDNYKKAFWINIYNAFIQIILLKSPNKYIDRRDFFTSKQIVIAKENISLDDIEHGILRRSKIKQVLGYVTNPFPSNFEKKHRVSKVDFRIHFCLNCGASSCPPIAFYKPESIDKQMDIATKSYLQTECNYNEVSNTVNVPSLLLWFKADFGSTKKIIELLHNIAVVPVNKKPAITFQSYNWNMLLNNYINGEQ